MFQTLQPTRACDDIDAPAFLSLIVQKVIIEGLGDLVAPIGHISILNQFIPKEHRKGVCITLYQPGNTSLRVIRQRKTFADNFGDALKAVRRHRRFAEFDVVNKTRIQFDFFNFVDKNISFDDFYSNQHITGSFEFGIDGLRFSANSTDHYFMPGDSYVRSIFGLGQLKRHLQRLVDVDRIEDCAVDRLRSTSVVSFGDRWLPLSRGHPIPVSVGMEDITDICQRAIGNIVSNFRPDGRFMYYYDAAKDSHVDHEHPKRDPSTNPYYNELRHCGGIVTLLLAYDRERDISLLSIVKDAIAFIERISQTYQTSEGRVARHLVYNRKSKLGGAGLALYALSLYQQLTGDDHYSILANELAEHLMSEVSQTGEFRYYYIYLDRSVTWEDNAEYFSFYYPGEAVIGLGAYLKWVNNSADNFNRIEAKIKAALSYLLYDRPHERALHYQSLPSDSWLMMAINELWDMPQFRDPLYAQFVFNDANKMVTRMYSDSNALFPDYVGGFYYEFGDFPYPDGARCEGLVAALMLADKLEKRELFQHYYHALSKTIPATIRLANTPESVYFSPNPEKAIGGIRFKWTRQWFRIDTIQHVVCYYYRLLSVCEGKGIKLSIRKPVVINASED